MTVCDKCGSNLGTGRIRFSMGAVQYIDGKEHLSWMNAIELDLCGRCIGYIRDTEFAKQIYNLNGPNQQGTPNIKDAN